MTYQSKVGETIDLLETCLAGKLSDEERQHLDAGRTDPDALWEAITGPDGLLMKAFTHLAAESDELSRCLAIYVTAAAKVKEETRIDIGIPYNIARASMRLTETERNRMARDQ